MISSVNLTVARDMSQVEGSEETLEHFCEGQGRVDSAEGEAFIRVTTEARRRWWSRERLGTPSLWPRLARCRLAANHISEAG